MIYHTQQPDQHHHIDIDFTNEKLGILSTLSNPGTAALQGLIYVPYTISRPPRSSKTQVLRYMLLPQIYWYVRHWLGYRR